MMSKLSDCQIRAMIRRCESTARMHAIGGRIKQDFRSLAKAAEYREELRQRNHERSKQ